MVLSDRSLRELVAAGRLRIDPFDPTAVQPSSVDLRLGTKFRVFVNRSHSHIDPRLDQSDLTQLVEAVPEQPFVLHPGEFVLGSTLEIVEMPGDLVGRIEGKSSLGRLGLMVHSTAGYVDPGFRGKLTLELANNARLPILLWPGMRVGQLSVMTLSTPADRPYGSPGLHSKYQDQTESTPSRAHLGFR
ncbi:MAG: dCTP deaminase [Actinobacteria bacterium]|nr:dCTP deaminase [Actinomycetota bacterium]